MTDAAVASAASRTYAGPERRRSSHNAATTDRLGVIADELAALRGDLAAFTTAQSAVNVELRAHVVRAGVLGELHGSDWEEMKKTQADTAARVRAVEDWRVEMRTDGTVLKLTFGVSIIGAVAAIAGLVNVFGAFGK